MGTYIPVETIAGSVGQWQCSRLVGRGFHSWARVQLNFLINLRCGPHNILALLRLGSRYCLWQQPRLVVTFTKYYYSHYSQWSFPRVMNPAKRQFCEDAKKQKREITQNSSVLYQNDAKDLKTQPIPPVLEKLGCQSSPDVYVYIVQSLVLDYALARGILTCRNHCQRSFPRVMDQNDAEEGPCQFRQPQEQSCEVGIKRGVNGFENADLGGGNKRFKYRCYSFVCAATAWS